MTMIRISTLALALTLTLGISHAAFAKAHVPVKKGQVCLNGKVLQVSENAIDALVERAGACELPACDFNNVFLAQEECSSASNPDGTCTLANPRDDAGGVTEGCPVGKF